MIDGAGLRLMGPEDIPFISKMLVMEGIQEKGHYHTRENNFTFILADEANRVQGFFTINFIDGYLNLQHFCVAREFRSKLLGWVLIRCVRDVAKKLGYVKMLVHGKGKMLNRLIRWYFKAEPYGTAEDGALLYLVMV